MAASTEMRNDMQNFVRNDVRNSWQNLVRNSWRHSFFLVPLGVTLFGCGGDTAGPDARANTATAYWALRLNQHAITLAVAPPHNTIQLHATPTTASGAVIANVGAVTYTIVGKDTSIAINASGAVTTKTPSYQTPIDGFGPVSLVIASLTIDGTTLTDTALIRVTATAPVVPLGRLSIQPPAESLGIYQSGHWLVEDGQQWLPLAQFDVNGDPVSDSLIYVRSSNLYVAYSTGSSTAALVSGLKPREDVTFYAQRWYYGVDVSDSLRVRIGFPHNGYFQAYQTTPLNSLDVQLYWWPVTMELNAPAIVAFNNISSVIPLDAIFDHPGAAHTDTAAVDRFLGILGFKLPISAEGSITPFHKDTAGLGAACAQSKHDGTTISADSVCVWKRLFSQQRTRMFTTPGTYAYHTRFGNAGKIIVH